MHADASLTWTDPSGRQRTTWPIDHLGVTLPPAIAGDPGDSIDDGSNRDHSDDSNADSRTGSKTDSGTDGNGDGGDPDEEEVFSIWEDVLELWTRQFRAGMFDDRPELTVIAFDPAADFAAGVGLGAWIRTIDPPPF